jgi:DNA end-binding protein Ku
MMLETLRFADEVRAAAPFFADVEESETNEELLDLAKDLIRRKSKKFDASMFHDHYTEALRALIEAKAKHKTYIDEDAGETGTRNNVIDLVAALRQSVKENERPPPAAKTPPAGKTLPARKRKSG